MRSSGWAKGEDFKAGGTCSTCSLTNMNFTETPSEAKCYASKKFMGEIQQRSFWGHAGIEEIN
eukprot:1157368-Pelagomonas_calceolata.AAC.4